tara:strand:+ start:219 stop:404 length:186 start_codon:yes stop_codon:yes gene_type:complete
MSTDRQPIHPIKTDPPDIVTGRKLSIVDMLLVEIERRLVLDDCERADLERVKEVLEGMDDE